MTTAASTSPPGDSPADALHTRTMSLFGASHIPRLGDTVLAVLTTLDAQHGTPDRIELRAFRANAPERAALALADEQRFRSSEGFIALLQVDLRTDTSPFPTDAAIDRVARLRLCALAPELHEAGNVTREYVLRWLLSTLVVHLNLGSFASLTGDARAFLADTDAKPDKRSFAERLKTSDFGLWGSRWLSNAGARVSDLEPGTFVLDLAASPSLRGGSDDSSGKDTDD